MDIGALDDGTERVGDLVEGDPLDLVGRGTGNVAVANGILGDDDVPAPLSTLARGSGNADVSLESSLDRVLPRLKTATGDYRRLGKLTM